MWQEEAKVGISFFPERSPPLRHEEIADMQLLPDPDWERKQRQREYRVAARREKRNRKADEKKQRTLNATILRRMVSHCCNYHMT